MTARLLWSTNICIKGFTRWTGMAWDGFTDTVSFLRQLEDDTVVIAAFTCSPLNPSSSPDHRLLTALCIHCGGLIRREGTVEGPGIARSIELLALHATVREATSLMVLMISFNDFDVLRQLAARDNPSSGSPHITYRWSCRRRRHKPLPLIGDGSLDLDFHGSPRIHDRFRRSQLKSEFASHWYMKTLNKRTRGDSEYFAYVWELIDPLTMRPTGRFYYSDHCPTCSIINVTFCQGIPSSSMTT
ncbi:hypothetical protein BC629DRAFT_809143 [Irpex lacteus]|nr:hypothetical protein BC629DRAFT_809143 [Irpex lacteus]